MRPILPALALLSLAACAGNPARIYSAPAPANALDCALGQAAALDFYPMDGVAGTGASGGGFLRLTRRADYTRGEAAREVGARLMSFGLAGSNRTEYDHMTITGAGGTLRIQTVGEKEDGSAAVPTEQAQADAQAILGACATGG
jgi:hypothetical protein